jgi:uncharacterized protein (TIGR03663 family)
LKSYENEAEQALISPDKQESQAAEAEVPLVGTPVMMSEDKIDLPEEDAPQEEQQHRRGATSSREWLWVGIAFWGVVLLGAVLRFWDLGAKPLHHDESLHAYFSMQLLHNNIENWLACAQGASCYRYDPLLHGPFQFHAIALVYLISRLLGTPDHGINTTTVRIAAALLGTVIVGLPYFLRQYLGKIGAWLACLLLAVSPSMVYFSRFAREDIYMACFTLMFIIAVIQYIRTRKISWAILAAVSFVLSYATKEATFLSIAVFGSFAGALVVWEIASHWVSTPQSPLSQGQGTARTFSLQENPRALLVVLAMLLVYFVEIGVTAMLLLSGTKIVSLFTNASQTNLDIAQRVVNNLKDGTVWVVPWLGILLALVVFMLLWRERRTDDQPRQRRGLARWVDPERQRLLDTIVTMPWTHWFFALVVGWTIFLVLFTASFTYIPMGIGDGIWQGLFYWITQQTVARGGQPWYYYFMLIPLYEQIGLIFGLVGIINCLLHPTRFRIFMVYWFSGNFFIYSWAGEKMPWLVIHMTMPLMILAAIGLRPIVERLIQFGSVMIRDSSVLSGKTLEKAQGLAPRPLLTAIAISGRILAVTFGGILVVMLSGILIVILGGPPLAFFGGILVAMCGVVLVVICGGLLIFLLAVSNQIRAAGAAGGGIFGGILAILALMLTLQNMYQLTYPHPADAKREPLIYVQTTPDVDIVMKRIKALDQKYYGGKHEIPIGVTAEASWPFYWYLRDYTCVSFNFTPTSNVAPNNSDACKRSGNAQVYPVVISAGEDISGMYTRTALDQYNHHEYEMRAQGNQGYMPPPCRMPCQQPPYTGVGLGVWLSWGNNPPPGATFDPSRAMMRVWQWWWQRIPIGRGVPERGDQYAPDDGSFMMALFIRKDLGVAP